MAKEKAIQIKARKPISAGQLTVHYDDEADVLYMHFGNIAPVDAAELGEGIILDLDEKDRVVGLTIIGLKKLIKAK